MRQPRIGALRHRLTIEAVSRVPDGGGGAIETWLPVADVWGAITPTGGLEATPAEAVAGSVTHSILVRHRADIVPAMRLRLGARLFEISAVVDIDERRRHLKLLCRERDL